MIGPWYVLPDEFLVSGESLIRNLRLGRQIARSFGAQPSNAGFVCDIFGHNSQMPQIFGGFGIHGGLIWRGDQPPADAPRPLARGRRHRAGRLPLPRRRLLRLRLPGRAMPREHQLQVTPATVNHDLDEYLRLRG